MTCSLSFKLSLKQIVNMAALMERLQKDGSVPLETYSHQVGGHHFLVKFGKDTICKPLSLRERKFYETLCPELRQFTPEYYGVITVSFCLQPSGGIEILGYPSNPANQASSPDIFSCSSHKSILGGDDQITSKATDGEEYVSPWSSTCEKILTEKLTGLLHSNDSFSSEYVVLENLTSKFIAPSILDLKVGTRQHGDGVSREKIQKQMEVCANSTSRALGVRLCGMQKYDASSNQYIFRDKYYGRDLNEEGFKRELKDFLHNGVEFREDLLANIILMLEKLLRVVEKQDSYRFFSSSLLIIYDGAQLTTPLKTKPHNGLSNGACGSHTTSHDSHMTLSETREHVDIRMIDFNHSTHTGCESSVKHSGPDSGYLVGLRSIIKIFSEQ